jgi:hypothetical protein
MGKGSVIHGLARLLGLSIGHPCATCRHATRWSNTTPARAYSCESIRANGQWHQRAGRAYERGYCEEFERAS